MISAAEARKELDKDRDRLIALANCKRLTEQSIRKAIEQGKNRCCLVYTNYTVDGTFYDVEKEIKEWLISFGYHFEPTGYVGAVWQLTVDIVW